MIDLFSHADAYFKVAAAAGYLKLTSSSPLQVAGFQADTHVTSPGDES